MPVSSLTARTVAPGTTAPCWSLTVPQMLPVVPCALPCARQRKKHVATRRLSFRGMTPSVSRRINYFLAGGLALSRNRLVFSGPLTVSISKEVHNGHTYHRAYSGNCGFHGLLVVRACTDLIAECITSRFM